MHSRLGASVLPGGKAAPNLQETKVSERGMVNLRYLVAWKRRWLDQLLSWREATIPYCTVRYAF